MTGAPGRGGGASARHGDDWQDEARAWIERQLGPIGSLEVRSKKRYSIVATVETDDGLVWFKELSSGVLLDGVQAPEPQLTAAVAKIAPRWVAEVLAADDTRLLTRHAGPTISSLALKSGGAGAPIWAEAVASYAEMQIDLAPAAVDVPAPDARPLTLAQAGDDSAARLVEVLGDSIPLSLALTGCHGDNVCFRGEAAAFIDWKSAVYGHPFCGMSTMLIKLVERFGAVVGGPDVLRVRDAYLEPWTAYAPSAELRQIFGAANALVPFYRAVQVDRIMELDTFPAAWREPYARKAAGNWRRFHALVEDPDRLGLGKKDARGQKSG